MISKQAVEEQLKRIGCNFRFWGRSEVNELGRILMEDEIIAECVNGEYTNGFAMLVATNHRLLLIDKKPLLYLTVEDYRYEMITEFNYNHRLMNATINVHSTNKTLTFTSWNQRRLRQLLEYIQAHVLEMRQQQHMAQQFQAAAAAQFAQLHVARSMQYDVAPQQYGNYGPTVVAEVPALPSQSQPLQAEAEVAPALIQAEFQSEAESVRAQTREAEQSSLLTPQQLVRAMSAKRMAKGLASGRAALGTYTRSKLPSFRRLQIGNTSEQTRRDELPEPQLNDYTAPYEYET